MDYDSVYNFHTVFKLWIIGSDPLLQTSRENSLFEEYLGLFVHLTHMNSQEHFI